MMVATVVMAPVVGPSKGHLVVVGEAMTLDELFLCLDGLRFRKQNDFDMEKAQGVFCNALSQFPANVQDRIREYCVKEKLLPAKGCDEALGNISIGEVDSDTEPPELAEVSEAVEPRKSPSVTYTNINYSPPDQGAPAPEDEADGTEDFRSWNRIAPGVEAAILRDFGVGVNKSELARLYGVSRRTVIRLVARSHRGE